MSRLGFSRGAAPLTACLVLWAGVGEAVAQSGAAAPLFLSSDPLDITLTADFSQLRDDRSDDAPERPAALTVGADTAVVLDAQLRTRGNFRRERSNCFLPPLRLNLKAGQVTGTVFEGQDKLKIVGNCRPGRGPYETLVLREFLAYEALRLVTETAFEVRLARITYVDTSGEDEPWQEFAFFIEDDEALAERLGAAVFELPEGQNLPPTAFDVRASTRLAIFQYMIGNTDWMETAGHNVEIFDRGTGGGALPIPYDFDFSGFVDAPYSSPAEDLPIRSVRERLYQGWCRPPGVAEAVVDEFRAAQPEIIARIEAFPFLDEGERRSARQYLDPFFEAISTPERAELAFLRYCRRLP